MKRKPIDTASIGFFFSLELRLLGSSPKVAKWNAAIVVQAIKP